MSQHVLDQLNEYVDGTLNADGRQQVREHVAHCDSCLKELEAIQSLLRSTSELVRSIEPERNLWNGIEKRILHQESGMILEFRRRHAPEQKKTGIRYAFAAAAILAALAFGVYWIVYYSRPAWNIEVTEGHAAVGSTSVVHRGTIRTGEVLQTGRDGHATIEVGTIGHVDVDPNTRIRLVEATLTDHRLSLEHGTIHATIFAPPRLFFVQTPSALAVDLGCAYTLSVDNNGSSIIQVTSGWVSLEFGGRESIIPAGARCATRPGFGPGTPYQEDTSPGLLAALTSYDFEDGGSTALGTVLREARNIDSITLWHLLFRTSGLQREKVYDRLALLVPPPEGVTKPGLLSGDPEMIKRWQKHLNLGFQPWWKFWQ